MYVERILSGRRKTLNQWKYIHTTRTIRKRAMHILVVEDEQRLAYLLRRVLLEERHTVDLAHEGHTGLNLAESGTYDIVILDVMLPGLDGLEICRQMRADGIMSPVLMLTERGAVEDRVAG